MRSPVTTLSLSLSLALTLSLALALALTFATTANAEGTPGKVLLKLEGVHKTDEDARASLDALPAAKMIGLTLEKRTVLGWIVADVDAADAPSTKAAIDKLKAEKGVLAAEAVTTKHLFRAPNDDLYQDLWGFSAIDIESAWDTTIGLSSQRIGIIDSGINRDHIDLIEHDVYGFDFVSDAQNGGDGNGRDADYSDTDFGGDFHGSHVAGTMVASANDGIGVPGLNWNAGLVTARALGSQGGSVVDIAEAAVWLAGGDIDGVPTIGNNRVSVINMSLGSDEPCGDFERDVYSAITAAGVTVVAAAGNTSNNEPTGSPANCPGVIAVAAAGPTFVLASYSNFDDRIDVVAPGGDGSVGDPSESILSIDGSGDFDYVAYDGTSMASPHVAGVVSLMQAVNPQLSPRQVKDLLIQSPFTCAAESCNNKAYLDAPSAVALAQDTAGELDGNTPPPGGGTGGGTGSGGSCPPNSRLTADGQNCQCDPGFVVNAQQTGCVPSGNNGGGGGDNGSCPANSTESADGQSCICDPGFVVNNAQTACVLPGNEADGGDGASVACEVSLGGGDSCDDGFRCVDGFCEGKSDQDSDDRDDRDDNDRDNSSALGCASTGAPGFVAGLVALLALANYGRRRRSLEQNTKLAIRAALLMIARASAALGLALAATMSVGCAHAVRIESTPGAEILVNGRSVGTSPAMYSETTGSSDSVQVTARLHGKENTVMVHRSDVDLAPIGAGAGIGAVTCGTGLAITVVSAFVFLPCALVTGAASWGALAVAPTASWLFFSHKMPDVVKVDLGDMPPPASERVAEGPRQDVGGNEKHRF